MTTEPDASTPRSAAAPAESTDPPEVVQRRRTGWDVLVGVLLILAGSFVLGDVAIATAISVLLLGWVAFFSGIGMLVGALVRIRSGGSWSAALGGGVLAVLGLFILRNPVVGALALTLLAGSLFLATGIIRIFMSGHFGPDRWIVVISGLVSVGLGVFVLLNPIRATLTLLGVLMGVQILIEGTTLLVAGRVRIVRGDDAISPAGVPGAPA
jgi:membrane protein HdeD